MTNRCYYCRRKIGLLGFKCTDCRNEYCTSHRHPEEHDCRSFHELIERHIQSLEKQLKSHQTTKNEFVSST